MYRVALDNRADEQVFVGIQVRDSPVRAQVDVVQVEVFDFILMLDLHVHGLSVGHVEELEDFWVRRVEDCDDVLRNGDLLAVQLVDWGKD